MLARKLQVSIPEDHRLQVDVPLDLPAGPAEIIVLIEAAVPQQPVDRAEAVRRVRGSMRDRLTDSETFAQEKQSEIDLEERHVGR